MSDGSLLLLPIVAVFVVLNGLFVSAEYALIRLRKSRVEEMSKSCVPKARHIKALQDQIERSIAGAQLGITLCSLIVGWIGERAVSGTLQAILNVIPGAERFAAPAWIGFAFSFALLSMAHIIVGEQVPKFLGIRFPESTLNRLAMPFRLFCRLMSPVLWLMTVLSNGLIKVLGVRQQSEEQRYPSSREFRIMVEESTRAGKLGRQESDLLLRALELKALLVKDVMRPKERVDYLRSDMSLAQVMKLVVDKKHGKLPVYDEKEKRVLGVLNSKDLFDVWYERFTATMGGAVPVPADIQSSFKLAHYVRQAHFVRDSMPVSLLLEEMRGRRLQMVMVSNDQGNTIGIVTLEDLIEQLVGEIWDEYDQPNANIHRIGNDVWRVGGSVTLFEFAKVLGVELDCSGSCATIAGVVDEHLRRPAHKGDVFNKEGLSFMVIEVVNAQASLLEVRPLRRAPARSNA